MHDPSNSTAVIADSWRTILKALGYDLDDPHLKGSPSRVADFMMRWHTRGREIEAGDHATTLTSFPNEEEGQKYDELVLMRDITFHSLCAHHSLPFAGVAHVGYLPGKKVIGVSKLARIVEHYSRQFQVQERLTVQIAECLMKELEPNGVAVVLEAEHMCVSMRGVRKPGHSTVTSALRGGFRENQSARLELLLLKGK
jgi:GTP cyclohydrolase I